MPLDDDAAYLALKARDARFDGRLFVGVTSTGIYCRPVCRVRTPRRENCRFFGTAAQAEAARFRPCLKCRPEIAPGLSHTDSSHMLAHTAAGWITQAVYGGGMAAGMAAERQAATTGDGQHGTVADATSGIAAIARRLGVTERHLRRIFQATHGVAPRDFQTTQRLLLAKQLLTDTTQPITQVALASGFGSLRRFNAAFVERYRLNPSQLRRQRGAAGGGGNISGISDISGIASNVDADADAASNSMLRLAYRPPYDIEAVLGHFARRVVPGVEAVDVAAMRLRRTLAVQHQGRLLQGWLALRFVPERHEVLLSAAPALSPALGTLLLRVRLSLDLDADPARIDPVLALLPPMHRAGALLAAAGAVAAAPPTTPPTTPPTARPGARLPGGMDGFEVAVRVILGQQVTVKAARTLVQRLVERFGTSIRTPYPDLTRLFPDAAAIAAADPAAIGTLGIVRQRVGALQSLARAVEAGHIRLERSAPLAATLQALRALPGIGDWTAQVIAMRALAWPDAWPAADIGLMQALGSRDPKRLTALAEPWRPWRAYAVLQFWHHLETRTEVRTENKPETTT